MEGERKNYYCLIYFKNPLVNNVTIQKMRKYTKPSETEKGNKIPPFFPFKADGYGVGIGYNIQDIVVSHEREKVPRIFCECCVRC